MNSNRLLLICLSAVLAILPPGAGQTTDASLVGDVVDAQHRAIAGAAISVTNSETGVKRMVESDAHGQYRVFPLTPGTYDVSATADGFSTQQQNRVVIAIAEQIKVDFQLAIGQVADTVEVNSQGSMLQTQDGSVGGIITGSELTRLPVNGRNYTTLMLLMPGVNDQGGGQSQGTFSGTNVYTVNGQRRQDNNFTLDGVDNNFLYQKSPGSSPPMDAIQEFKVLNNTSAEFGRSPGANVNVAIKSGTRDLHRSAYEYFRNDALDANDFFNNAYGTGKLPYRQNQYGLSGGGPVLIPKIYNGRNRTFWFASWEGFRNRQGELQVSNTPTLIERNGNFSDVMRIVKAKFMLSDVLDTEHAVEFVHLDSKRVYSRSRSKRINEVAAPGQSGEHQLPAGEDRGLLWRLYGYWFFEERDGGVYIACESITLTRDIPFGLNAVLGPVIHDMPGESLRKSLDQTRKAVVSYHRL